MKLILAALLTLFTASAFGWQYATPIASPITTTTAVTLKAAGAGVSSHLTGLQIINTHATVSTIVTVKDGSTVIWTGFVPATTAALPIVPLIVNFQTPLKGSPNSALTFVANTTGANIFVNAQGLSR